MEKRDATNCLHDYHKHERALFEWKMKALGQEMDPDTRKKLHSELRKKQSDETEYYTKLFDGAYKRYLKDRRKSDQ